MKKNIFLLLISIYCLSCQNKSDSKNIKFNKISNVTESELVVIEIETEEDFFSINEKLTFGLECVANKEDFDLLSNEELSVMKEIDDIIQLNRVKENVFNFSISESNINKIPKNKCFYCRFTRPDFLFTNSYRSSIFKVSN